MRDQKQPRLKSAFIAFFVSSAAVFAFGIWLLVTERIPEQASEVAAPDTAALETTVLARQVVPEVTVPRIITVPQGEIRLVPIPEDISLNPGVARAFFDGVEIPVFDYGPLVYVLVPVGAQKSLGTYEIEIREDEQLVYLLPVTVVHREFPKDTLNIPYEFVEFPQEVKDSIREVKRPFRDALRRTSATRRWSTGFSYPLDIIDTTGFFGEQRVYTNYATPFHSGVDLRAASGTPVLSISEGKVLWGGGTNLYFEGNAVVIDHGQKIISMYLHLDSVEVETDDTVRRGEIIGLSGATGFGTAPHLHFAVKVGGEYVDPLQFIQVFQSIRSTQ